MSSWGVGLWDGESYVESYTATGLSQMLLQRDFFEERSKIEASYAKQLR
jgi:hypothetical protein